MLELWIAAVLCLNRSRGTNAPDKKAIDAPLPSPSIPRHNGAAQPQQNALPITASPKVEPLASTNPQSNSSSNIPLPPVSAVRIVSISAGWNHSCAISGKITSQPSLYSPSPSSLLGSKSFTQFALLLDEGTLYTWGKNSSGELGHGEKVKRFKARKRADQCLTCKHSRVISDLQNRAKWHFSKVILSAMWLPVGNTPWLLPPC